MTITNKGFMPSKSKSGKRETRPIDDKVTETQLKSWRNPKPWQKLGLDVIKQAEADALFNRQVRKNSYLIFIKIANILSRMIEISDQ